MLYLSWILGAFILSLSFACMLRSSLLEAKYEKAITSDEDVWKLANGLIYDAGFKSREIYCRSSCLLPTSLQNDVCKYHCFVKKHGKFFVAERTSKG